MHVHADKRTLFGSRFYNVRLGNSQLRLLIAPYAILEIGPGLPCLADKLEDFFSASAGGGAGFSARLLADSPVVVGFIFSRDGVRSRQILNNTNNSSTSLNENNHCDAIGQATRWLVLVPTTNEVLFVDTVGSAIPTVAAIYVQSTAGDFAQLAVWWILRAVHAVPCVCL